MAASPSRPSGGGPSIGGADAALVLRYVLGGVGAFALLLGGVAVFVTLNGAGSFALIIGGVVLILAALGQIPGTRNQSRSAQGVRDSGALRELLGSADAGVRMAAAEAVLGHGHGDRPAPTGDPRDLALDVLLERDLIRRLADLLRRAGYAVESDGSHAAATPGADLVVRVTRSDGVSAVPVALSTSSGADAQPLVQRIGTVASRIGARSALALHTGHQASSTPLSHLTTVGEVRVATVFSPQLSDEHAIIAALAEAAQTPAERPTGLPLESSTG